MMPPVKPIAIKDRLSILFVEYGQLDVLDGAFVMLDKNGVHTHIPVGSVVCLMLEPGTRISHEAVKLAANTGCLLVWVGEAGVRLYAAGQPGGARSDRLLFQAKLALDDQARLNVVRKMYTVRFGEEAPVKRSVAQLRGVEGGRVKERYKELAAEYGIDWQGRRYDPKRWNSGDLPNRCLSAATACLYGLSEAAILAAGYAPAIGFIHTGKPLSFVYDIADLFKFETVVPAAFSVAADNPPHPEQAVRLACRDAFRETRLLKNIIPIIEEVLSAGGLLAPEPPEESVPPAIPVEKGIGDAGHRS